MPEGSISPAVLITAVVALFGALGVTLRLLRSALVDQVAEARAERELMRAERDAARAGETAMRDRMSEVLLPVVLEVSRQLRDLAGR